jgi:hypothetical protein
VWDVIVWLYNGLKAGAGIAVDLAFGILAGAGKIIYGVLSWLWDVSLGISKAAIDIGFGAITGAGKAIYEFLVWLWEVTDAVRELEIKFAFAAFDAVTKTAMDILEWIKDVAIKGIDIVLNVIPKQVGEAVKTAGDWWSGATTGAGNLWGILGPSTPSTATGQSGGSVEKTGFAKIHKGETIIPAGGGLTVNIYGTYQNDEDLYKKFVDKLRRDQWRQNV